jgi:hypothetical protein
MKEWEQCEGGIARYDTIMFSIRTWAVTVFVAMLGIASTLKNPTLVIITVFPTVLLFLIDAVNKSFQQHFIDRAACIQRYLASDRLTADVATRNMSFPCPVFAETFADVVKIKRLKAISRSVIQLSVYLQYAAICMISVLIWLFLVLIK